MTDPESRFQLHIHVSGEDRPGILAEALESVVGYECLVMDIKQFVFSGLLSLSMLVESGEEKNIRALEKALSAYGEKEGVQVTATPWQPDFHPEAVYKHRMVVTILGRRLGPVAMVELTRTLAGVDINIFRIEQLDIRDNHVLEFVIGTKEPMDSLEVFDVLVRFKENFEVDIAVQEDTLFHRNKRLIVMDADMTFLQCEVIDELGKLAGAGEAMKKITHAAMNGEVDFTSALKQRVALLKGLPVSELEALAERIPLTPGAEDLVRVLQHLGYRIAIISGGFQFFIDKLQSRYRLDYSHANHLVIKDGIVTGEIEGDVIDAKAKEDLLVSMAKREGIALEQVVAVGDGANDIHMLARAGLGIAFNAKPIVQKHARASLTTSNLELILYFLGITGADIEELKEVSRR